MTEGTPPPPGAVLTSVNVHLAVSGRGYGVALAAEWTDPASRAGFKVKDVVKRYRKVTYVSTPTRPGLRELTRIAAMTVWATSISDVASLMDGQEPLPGL